MNKTYFLSLQPTEQSLTIAASQIFAAYIMSGKAVEDPKTWMERAVEEAILIGQRVDERVVVPGEMS